MKLVVGNFKMNLLEEDINHYLSFNLKYDNVVFCPSQIYLKDFIKKGLKVGSQDTSPFNIGAYTGDVSAVQLKSIGVTYSLVGHSERREYYHDGVLVNKKIKSLLENEITPILCIGENKNDYENNNTFNILKDELDEAFKDIEDVSNIIIAYEPIWAIGTGLVPTNQIIENVIKYIKEYTYKNYKVYPSVLYGGSVNNKNVHTLNEINNLDGFLVGGCSLKVNDFIELINIVNNNLK